jgi:hypothetical protein
MVITVFSKVVFSKLTVTRGQGKKPILARTTVHINFQKKQGIRARFSARMAYIYYLYVIIGRREKFDWDRMPTR